jgi:hypothetical protein
MNLADTLSITETVRQVILRDRVWVPADHIKKAHNTSGSTGFQYANDHERGNQAMHNYIRSLLGLMVIGFLFCSQCWAAETVTLSPTDDATVESWAPTSNDNGYRLWLQEFDAIVLFQRAYLKFHLGDIPDSASIIKAELRMYGDSQYGTQVALWHVLVDTWTENGDEKITWNNRPAVDTLLTSAFAEPMGYQYFDLLEGWAPGTDLADDYLSICVMKADEDAGCCSPYAFISRDHLSSEWRPQLYIEYEENGIDSNTLSNSILLLLQP